MPCGVLGGRARCVWKKYIIILAELVSGLFTRFEQCRLSMVVRQRATSCLTHLVITSQEYTSMLHAYVLQQEQEPERVSELRCFPSHYVALHDV